MSQSIKSIASKVPTLLTPRLILSKITFRDARDMYDYSKLESTTRFLLWSPHPSLRYTKEYISLLESKYESCEFYDWGVRESKNGKLIGTCGFTSLNEEKRKGEIGYVLSPKVWGKGYAAEAAERVIQYGFEVLDLNAITARYMYGNLRSERVMQKLNMTCQGVLPEPLYVKGAWRTVVQYRITKEEYLNKKKTL